jgi:plasmid stability protein
LTAVREEELMGQLVIPDVEEAILQRLRERARARGTTAEAEARVVLAEALRPRASSGSVERASIPNPLDVSERLEAIKVLKDGWLDGAGAAPDHDALDWLASAFARFYTGDAPLPHLYPTATGGVRAEWSLGSHEASLEVCLPDHSAEWHLLNLDTDETDIRALSLDEPNDWEWLLDRIRELSQRVA